MNFYHSTVFAIIRFTLLTLRHNKKARIFRAFLLCERDLNGSIRKQHSMLFADPGVRAQPVGCARLAVATVTTLRKDLLPDFRRERRSMQPCNSRSYPRNSDKISLSRALTTIYIILPFRWFLFLIDRERRSMQQCNSRSYPRNSAKISLSRAQNTSLRHFTVSQVSDMDFDGTKIPRRGCAR